MNAKEQWPIVQPDDDGIRPAGPPDACFYCLQKVGQPHSHDCVIVEKKVRVRYIFEVDLMIPYHWDKYLFEFHRNESSWCADNAIDDLKAHIGPDVEIGLGPHVTSGPCLCDRFHAEFVEVLDDTPTASRRKP